VFHLCFLNNKIVVNQFTFKSLAFIATTIVLALINTAPIAGLSMNAGYSIPAANGMATTL
jgi:hypothetical protein